MVEEPSPEWVEARLVLAHKIAAHHRAEGNEVTAIPGLTLFRRTEPTTCTSAAYEPTFIVYVQGEKRVNVGGETFWSTSPLAN